MEVYPHVEEPAAGTPPPASVVTAAPTHTLCDGDGVGGRAGEAVCVGDQDGTGDGDNEGDGDSEGDGDIDGLPEVLGKAVDDALGVGASVRWTARMLCP